MFDYTVTGNFKERKHAATIRIDDDDYAWPPGVGPSLRRYADLGSEESSGGGVRDIQAVSKDRFQSGIDATKRRMFCRSFLAYGQNCFVPEMLET